MCDVNSGNECGVNRFILCLQPDIKELVVHKVIYVRLGAGLSDPSRRQFAVAPNWPVSVQASWSI